MKAGCLYLQLLFWISTQCFPQDSTSWAFEFSIVPSNFCEDLSRTNSSHTYIFLILWRLLFEEIRLIELVEFSKNAQIFSSFRFFYRLVWTACQFGLISPQVRYLAKFSLIIGSAEIFTSPWKIHILQDVTESSPNRLKNIMPQIRGAS